MWTPVIVIATTLILATVDASFNDHFPSGPQSVDQLAECMVPGQPPRNPPLDSGKKRFVVAPNRPEVAEPLEVIHFQPGLPTEPWTLPSIQVQPPFGNIDMDLLDMYLNASDAMNMVTSKTDPAGRAAPNPNDVFGRTVLPPEIPKLDELSAVDMITVENYAREIGLGMCPANFRFIERPPFYYPRYQVQGFCSGDSCGLPQASDHQFGQTCRPDPTALISIRALRWDCCQSWDAGEQDWVGKCGWRQIVVNILAGCVCTCEHDAVNQLQLLK